MTRHFKTCFSQLICSACSTPFPSQQLHNLCLNCGMPLLAEYDLPQDTHQRVIDTADDTLWRYRAVLPVYDRENIITLGEGMTPLIQARCVEREYGYDQLFIKDESNNPTGSFKARGLAMAVSKAKELGVKKCVIPTAGNAGGAMSAYCAKAGIEAHVFMPADTPQVFKDECSFYGAQVTEVDGLITDCGKIVKEQKDAQGWFDVSTLKEPYRIEGKKTMGYELAEQFGWSLPDVILYPTGGGTGLIGMWKAFGEMERMGWIGKQRPRMISVQAAGCAPIVRAFEQGDPKAAYFENAQTLASGLRVPAAIGDFLILQAVRKSNGCAVSVTDEELLAGTLAISRLEGILPAPEGGATLAALRKLTASGLIDAKERIVLFNTGSGYKYLDNMRQAVGN